MAPSPTSPIEKVTLVGANGNLGSEVLTALLTANPTFRVTVIRRQGSTSSPPPEGVRIVEVSKAWTVDELQRSLEGEDAVVTCFPLRDVDEHLRLADAAAAAGVRRFIPADYGSVDSRSARARELVPLFDRKRIVRERLGKLSDASTGANRFTWTSLVCGHFFDWGLTNGFLHFYPKERRADILGDGTAKSSNATLGQVAKAVVRVLQRTDVTENRVLMIQSFCVSQNDVLRSLERATGAKWDATHVDIDAFIQKHKLLVEGGNRDSIEDLVFALGVIEGNWEGMSDFAMDLLGLENEDLDEVVRKAISA